MKELKLKGAQSPLKQGVNMFCSCFPETLCNNVSYPGTGLSLGPELIITQHDVLLMEMLFLGSMLMIYKFHRRLARENLPGKVSGQDILSLCIQGCKS